MHVYIRICMYICTYARLYVRMYVDTYLRIYVSTYLRIYVSTYLRIYVSTYLRIYVCMYVRMYVCLYVSRQREAARCRRVASMPTEDFFEPLSDEEVNFCWRCLVDQGQLSVEKLQKFYQEISGEPLSVVQD